MGGKARKSVIINAEHIFLALSTPSNTEYAGREKEECGHFIDG